MDVRFKQRIPGARSWIYVQWDNYRGLWRAVSSESEHDSKWDDDSEEQGNKYRAVDDFLSGCVLKLHCPSEENCALRM